MPYDVTSEPLEVMVSTLGMVIIEVWFCGQTALGTRGSLQEEELANPQPRGARRLSIN